MSRREDRSSDSKRRHSRFDREPSPKRSRRDGKPETERLPTEPESSKDRSERESRRRRLQDPLPLESQASKNEPGNISKESEKASDGHQGGAKHSSSDPVKMPQSRSYFQHDERGSAGQNGRSFSRRPDSERGWWRDHKEQQSDRAINKTESSDTRQRDEKSKGSRERSHAWRHDGYFEMEANQKPSVRKRPAFREQKMPADPEKTNKSGADPVMPNPQDHAIDGGKRNEREHSARHSDRSERPFSGERDLNKAQSRRGNFSPRDRNNANRGRDRFSAKQGQGYHPSGGRADKWKHDLYDEANKSPPPKNEEDQISKIEALLAS